MPETNMIRTKNDTPGAREGIIFIPDISGFTRFVHETDIQLGKKIVAELLSTILHTNILNMKVSEIEGDAILFYRYGPLPPLKVLLLQYEIMLIAFKRKVRKFNEHRSHALRLDLSLKLIVHFGSIVEYKLYGFRKLYGEAIIEAHRLLKNDIPSHNYILITQDFFDRTGDHEAQEIILPKWVKKQITIPNENNTAVLPFTYFLYDTEILKANVLQSGTGKSKNPTIL